jgi:phosphoribosylformylglycinamidine synthase subunit PurQ / glutaminase
MAKTKVLILRAPGTNCNEETAHAFELAGGDTEQLHINRVLEAPRRLDDFQVLCIPGGFSYGDDIAAGRILGNQIQHHLADALKSFRDAGKLIIGICNGFQVLLKTNLLASADQHGPTATLTLNDSAKFEARWVHLAVDPGKSVFLAGIEHMELRLAHAEGKFVTRDESIFKRMEGSGQFVLRYSASGSTSEQSAIRKEFTRRGGKPATGPRVPYPANPNGAMGDVAGICDETGRVFGLMPHPEGFVDHTQHPQWTRRPNQEAGDGLRIFQNAVRYFR